MPVDERVMQRISPEAQEEQIQRLLRLRGGSFILKKWTPKRLLAAGGNGEYFFAAEGSAGGAMLRVVYTPSDAADCAVQGSAEDAEFAALHEARRQQARTLMELSGAPNIAQLIERPEVFALRHADAQGRMVVQYAVLICMPAYDLEPVWRAQIASGEAVLRLTRDVARALEELEKRGITHGSVTLSAVVYDPQHGCYRLMEPRAARTETADTGADLYALGRMVGGLLGGVPDVPPRLAQAALRACARPPQTPYAGAGELLADLDGIENAADDAGRTDAGREEGRAGRRGKMLLCAAIVLLAAAVVWAAYTWISGQQEPKDTAPSPAVTEPTAEPTLEPTQEPTAEPTLEPTPELTAEPTPVPTQEPTAEPTLEPTPELTFEPTAGVKGGLLESLVTAAEEVHQSRGLPRWDSGKTMLDRLLDAQQQIVKDTPEPTAEPTPQPTAEPTPMPGPTAEPDRYEKRVLGENVLGQRLGVILRVEYGVITQCSTQDSTATEKMRHGYEMACGALTGLRAEDVRQATVKELTQRIREYAKACGTPLSNGGDDRLSAQNTAELIREALK